MKDYQAWGVHPELQSLAELYSVNINVYDIIPSSNSLYHISSGLNTVKTIKLFYTGDHYDSPIPRDVREGLQTWYGGIEKSNQRISWRRILSW